MGSTIQCASKLVPTCTPGTRIGQEDWGIAIPEVANCYKWLEGTRHIIIAMFDEGPFYGDPCNSTDLNQIRNAVDILAKTDVVVIPVIGTTWGGTQDTSCIDYCANLIATRTNGIVFYTQTYRNDEDFRESICSILRSSFFFIPDLGKYLICKNECIRIGGSITGGRPPYNYYWTPPDGLDNPFSLNPVACPPRIPMRYTFEIWDANSCYGSGQVLIDTFNKQISLKTENISKICPNQCVKLNAIPLSGYPPYKYTWTPSKYLDDPFSENPLCCPMEKTVTYSVKVEDSLGCYGLGNIQVIIDTYAIGIDNSDTFLCKNDCIDLIPRIKGGTPPYSFMWEPLNIFQNPFKEIQRICPDYDIKVTLNISDSYECKGKKTFMILSKEIPEVKIISPKTQGCYGSYVNLKAEVISGNPPYKYKWLLQNQFEPSDTSQEITIHLENSEWVKLEVIDSIGCKKIDSIFIPVHKLYPVKIKGDSIKCVNTPVKFTSNPSDCNDYYYWLIEDSLIIENTFSINHTFEKPGIYNIIFVDSCFDSCITKDSFRIRITEINDFDVQFLEWNLCKKEVCFDIFSETITGKPLIKYDIEGNGNWDVSTIDYIKRFCFFDYPPGESSKVIVRIEDEAKCVAVDTESFYLPTYCCSDYEYPPGNNFPACLIVPVSQENLCKGSTKFYHYLKPNQNINDTINDYLRKKAKSAFMDIEKYNYIYPLFKSNEDHPELHHIKGFDKDKNLIEDFTGMIEVRIYYDNYKGDIPPEIFRMFKLDETKNTWKLIDSSGVNINEKYVWAKVGKLGDIFTIMGIELPDWLCKNFSVYPNPFSPKNEDLNIYYVLSENARAKVEIYTISGGKVFEKSLKYPEEGGIGTNQGKENIIKWDGKNLNGRFVSNGIYIILVEIQGENSGKICNLENIVAVSR